MPNTNKNRPGDVQGIPGSGRELFARLATPAEYEEPFRLLLERAPVSIAMFDAEMRFIAVSRRFIRDLGMESAQAQASIIGRSHYELFPEFPERWRAIHRRVLAGETLSAEWDSFSRLDGSTDWINWEMTPWRRADGSIGGALIFAEVVTAQKRAQDAQEAFQRAEAALQDSDFRLRMAQRIGGIGVMDWDLKSGQAVCTDEYATLHGLPPRTETDNFESWMMRVHPEDRDRVLADAQAALATGGPRTNEYRIVRPSDGEVRWLSQRCEVLTDKDGRRSRVICSQRDVTDERNAQAVLARDKAELEGLVEVRTRDLDRTRARLAHAERMEALGALAGGIAHDINNVLQAIKSGASLIKRHPEDQRSVVRFAGLMAEEARRGAAVTRRLLAFARRSELQAAPIAPLGLLEGMREILKLTLGAGVEMRIKASRGLPPLLADERQLETVLVNLAANARDAMPGGGVLTLSADLDVREREFTPAGSTHHLGAGRYIRLCVTDSGQGMSPDVLARVMEPFYTTKPQGKGTGLGLAMANDFAEQSGGAFAIESEPGRGTTATLWLPVAEASAAAKTAPGGILPAPTSRQGRILLVDDDDAVRDVMANELGAQGYTVTCARGGAEALAILDSGQPLDLLISDFSMPGVDGATLIRQALDRRPGLPTMLLTGFAADTADLTGGAIAGAFSLVYKPIASDALADRIDSLLDRAVRRRAAK